MSEIRELSFCELRRKEIVSIGDGRRLGRILDLVFTPNGKVQGIVAPYGRKFLFFRSQEVYIPYNNIKTIGEDIILVDIDIMPGQKQYRGERPREPACKEPVRAERREEHPPEENEKSEDGCDGRCDKCMLFDCEHRWKKRNSIYVDNEPYK